MKRVVLLAAFAILFFALVTQTPSVSATYCDSNADCPDTYYGNYCWNGEIWNYKQDWYCVVADQSCEPLGDPADNKVTVCQYDCADGSSACNSAPTCSDGVQNQGETGVDCGGPCSACTLPACGSSDCTTWGSCGSDGSKSCTAYASTCTAPTTAHTTTCTYTAPTCTATDCATWGACSSSGSKSCSTYNAGCTAPTTAVTTTCTYTALPSHGESCASTGVCQTGLTCDSDNICREYVGLGAGCGGNYVCQSGSTCSNSGYCFSNTDAAYGEACGTGIGKRCSTNLQCSAVTGVGTCKRSNGQSCSGATECYGGYCNGGVCASSQAYSCQGPFPPDGTYSACAASDTTGLTSDTASALRSSSSQCSESVKCEYLCNSGYGVYAGSCRKIIIQDDGETCDGTWVVCEAGHVCRGGKCYSYCGGTEPTNGPGIIKGQEIYDSNNDNRLGPDVWTYLAPDVPGIYHCQWECITGYYQDGSACSPKKANGVACTANGQCTSGTCSTTTNKCSGGTATCDATNCAADGWSACSGGSKTCNTFNTGCTVPTTPVTQTCTTTPVAPTINSFSVTPSTVTEGASVTFSGSATAGSSCVTRHRARVTGSQQPADGGWTTLSGCPSTITIGSSHSTTENPLSFYNNPGTYTVRWELETVSGQTAYQDRSVTVNSGTTTTCTPETDAQFCSRLGKNCGSVTANDNCNVQRTVSNCGTCTGSNTCGGSGTPNICGSPTTYSCTGNAPGNAQLCNNDDQGLNEDTPRTLASSCTIFTKCQYTCTSPYVYSGSGATATCVLPSSLTTVEWKGLEGAAITQVDLNDRVVMRANGNQLSGKTVVFTLYKRVTGFDEKLESFTVTPESNTLATYSTTMTTSGNIYFKANATSNDHVESATLVVSTVRNNDPPNVTIVSPVQGGIYFVNNLISFNQTTTDKDSRIQSYLWNFGDGTTNSSNESLKRFTTPGQKTVTLSVTDEHGAVVRKQVSFLVSASPSIFAFIDTPAQDAAIVSSNYIVQYSAGQSYLINVTYTGTPCTTTVVCLSGTCPTQTQQSPSCSANTNTQLNVQNGGQANYNWNNLLFNWTFRDGSASLTPDSGLGKVSGSKGFSNAGVKNITLQLRYTPAGAPVVQSTYTRGFTLLNQRQCSSDGATWYNVNNGFITGSSSTLNTAACAGADQRANTPDDCCPGGMTCSTSTSNPGCVADSSAQQGCASYTTLSACQNDSAQRVLSEPLWNYQPYHCGQTYNGRNYFCSCAWDAGACRFNASSRDDLGGGTISCTYTTTTDQCVDGYQAIHIIATSNNVGNDPLCVNSTQTIPCGRPVVALPFAGLPQIIAAIVLIAIVYFIIHRQRKSKKRR